MISLNDYINQNSDNSDQDKSIFKIISQISDGIIQISKILYAPKNINMFGKEGSKNIHGEKVEKLDLIATNIFLDYFIKSQLISDVICEELDAIKTIDTHSSNKYIIMMDPLDGSSNIDVSVSIGSIFGVWEKESDDFVLRSYTGDKQVMSMYAVYGPNTVIVFAFKNRVCSFILDENTQFVLLNENIELPTNPMYYSTNESNYDNWTDSIKSYVDVLKQDKNLTQRYVGSLVADFHRNLIKGGVFLNPKHKVSNRAKLRLMYEANPLANIIETAGGKSFSNGQETMKLIPENIHQSVSLIMGNSDIVKNLE
tara:strand:- start:2634 stop:3569 length:936 start_codon:yes stop_codon:yes gene_type:complete